MALTVTRTVQPPAYQQITNADGTLDNAWTNHFQTMADKLSNVTQGTTTNDDATAGQIGETSSVNVLASAGVALVSGGTITDVMSIPLTAGDWDVSGVLAIHPVSTSTSFTFVGAGISTTAGVIPDLSTGNSTIEAHSSTVPGLDFSLSIGPVRVSLANSLTCYLAAEAGFTGGATAYGFLRARRMR